MLVYKTKYQDKTPCVLALGCFDTVHLGHKKLMETALLCAREQKLPMGIYMFETRPAHMLCESAKADVYSSKEREHIFESIGVNYVYYEVFSKDFMQMSPEEFVRYLKKKFNVQTVVVGFNYRFGKNAAGDSVLLKEICARYNIEVVVVPAVCDAQGVISSTRIRQYLEDGDIQRVNSLLGREYILSGEVKKDRGVGRGLGFPTANLEISNNLLLPKNGVYATVVRVGNALYPAVTNIGTRPTFGLDKRSVESHLIGFNGDLYNQNLKIMFFACLREEIAFNDAEELQKQILFDINATNKFFSKINLETLKI